MLLVYNLLLTLVGLLALPFLGAALLWKPRYRRGLGQRLGLLPSSLRSQLCGFSPFWLHAPSVGEVLAIRPFLQALKDRYPGSKVLLSVLTPTGYETARSRVPEADAVVYFPLDHGVVVRRVLKILQPRAFFFTETEVWPNFLLEAARQGVPTFLVSGRVSARTLRRLRLLGPLFHRVLERVSLFCLQSETDAQRLRQAGVAQDKIAITGNFKVDQVQEGGERGKEVLREAGLASRLLFVAASTHRGEEEIVLRAYRRLRVQVPSALLLLAPRYPERFSEVEGLLKRAGEVYLKRSRMEHQPKKEEASVFLLDTLGELSSFYSAATLAFVGGSLVNRGGHSVIEPALAGVPVLFGPYMQNLASLVEELKREGGGREVRDEEALYREALKIMSNARLARIMGGRALAVVQKHRGAAERTLGVIHPCLS